MMCRACHASSNDMLGAVKRFSPFTQEQKGHKCVFEVLLKEFSGMVRPKDHPQIH